MARAVALRRLAAAPRTRSQLREAMLDRGVPEDAAERVLDRFEEVDLVDDAEFARQWVTTRHAGRGLARRALREELRRRGVPEEAAAPALALVAAEDEEAAARDLVRRRARSSAGEDQVRRVRRLVTMLGRRGYGRAVAVRVVREVLAEEALHGGADPASVPDPDDVVAGTGTWHGPAGDDDGG